MTALVAIRTILIRILLLLFYYYIIKIFSLLLLLLLVLLSTITTTMISISMQSHHVKPLKFLDSFWSVSALVLASVPDQQPCKHQEESL